MTEQAKVQLVIKDLMHPDATVWHITLLENDEWWDDFATGDALDEYSI